MENPKTSRKSNLGVFYFSCWVLVAIAFAQLMAVGAALALRGESSMVDPQPQNAQVVERDLILPGVASTGQEPLTVVSPGLIVDDSGLPAVWQGEDAEEADFLANLKAVAAPSKAAVQITDQVPPIADPVVEKLLKEAADARIRSDLSLAHAKLMEAEMRDPKNPNVLYALALNYEALGIGEKASPYYMEIFQAGLAVGGAIYQQAALKIARGWAPEVKDLASLGWARMTGFERGSGGEKRTLLLPVSVSQTKDFEPKLFKPRVRFYEEIDGKVVQATIQEGDFGSEWVTGAADWATGEEMAEIWYLVRDQDPSTRLLFGERAFHGFVAELYYDGRLVDIIATPRTLLREGGHSVTLEDLRRDLDDLDGLTLEDLTAGSSLLPKKE